MVRALFYLQVWSLWNRLVAQARRLRQPKYLAAVLAGAAYFYFFFGRGFAFGGFQTRPEPDVSWGFLALAEGMGAVVLAVLVASAWFFPEKRVSLDFTEAEIAFLFPAPISRRGLIHYRIVRAQAPLLFGALIMMLVTGRFAQAGQAWTYLIGWWLMLAALELHRLGAAFARTRLMDRGVTHGQRRAAVFGLLALVGVVAAFWGRATFIPPTPAELEGGRALAEYLQRTVGTGPWYWILLPFRLVVRPIVATSAVDFLMALLPMTGVILGLYLWVLRSAVSFEEASLERAQARAHAVAAVRSGRWPLARPTRKQSAPFPLRPTGPRALAFTWKNLIALGTAFTPRLWIALAFLLILALVVLKGFMRDSIGLKLLGTLPLGIAPMLFLVGPQLLTVDLRQDLTMADALKTYPLPGWQLVLGEVLAPVCVLTAVHWLLVAMAVVAFPDFGRAAAPDVLQRLAIGLAMAVVVPGLNLVSFLIYNAAVLLFPAWARLGLGQMQGFEATGRNLLLMLGQTVTLAITLLLPAAVFAAVFFMGRLWVPWLILLPAGGVASLLVLLLEAYAGLRMMGDLFERLDVSAELTQGGA